MSIKTEHLVKRKAEPSLQVNATTGTEAVCLKVTWVEI